MTVGERIKKRRVSLGLSVDEVADTLGKNRATVYRYESNDIENLPAKVLAPLAEALKTTPAYLMGWTDDPYDYELDPDSILSDVPTMWMRAWDEEDLSTKERWYRYLAIQEASYDAYCEEKAREHKKTPGTLVDVESLSDVRREMWDFICRHTDEEIRQILDYAHFLMSRQKP